MAVEKTWRWRFLGFESPAEGRVVQRWFKALPEDPERYEIVDLLDTLQKTNDRLWSDEVFDPLRGAKGISEIKIPNIKCFREGKFRVITYRVYGFFGPTSHDHCYTFLHGTEKGVKNDTIGKQIAEGRLEEIRRGLATVHEFKFQGEPDSALEEGARHPN
jgi:hypothetical protein